MKRKIDNHSEQSRAEQSRAEQSRAEQSRAEQSTYSVLNHKFKHLQIFIIILIVILLIILLGAGYCGLRIYNHVKSQDDSISQYRERINNLEIRLDEVSPELDDDAKTFISKCDKNHYNILFVGNSITRHGIVSYWWSDKRGMASSSINRDYVHVVENDISNNIDILKPTADKGLNGYAFNYSVWETNSHDRAQTYPIMDKYLKAGKEIDCVVIQLGENVPDAGADGSTYETDYVELIEHIKSETPNAKVITVGDFWADSIRDSIKKSVATKENVGYVDLSYIQDKAEYEAGMGAEVDGDDGQQHKIEHSGTAKHPGDKGMEWIGERVAKAILE